ncbi:HNH endonuclease family protein [Streptomyces sp. DSM 41529]|uniref:HNH endonuclease family protein n=2 Tax=Streptomyces lonegramiae TaxID=3075524 RepID=A0ABU2XPA1_9ACTN|nr:HNH endonuclease family protein [Streptomyces sp. DSM 41529]MDT0547760.1 HNH endonuclease family protein [Streptomyces sp. DSM 41529]
MMMRRWAAVAATLLMTTGLISSAAPSWAAADTPSAVAAPASEMEMPEPPTAEEARAELDELTVAPEDDVPGYSRSQFPHWINQHGTCDTREVVLQRDGADVTQDDQCRAVSGHWVSPYDGVAFDAAGQLDIDHVVPLKEAWRSGAAAWTTEDRKAFANDLVHSQLIAVSARSNRSKSDKDPANWQPPLAGYRCTYGRAWISVKHVYGLAVDPAERSALEGMLDTCA